MIHLVFLVQVQVRTITKKKNFDFGENVIEVLQIMFSEFDDYFCKIDFVDYICVEVYNLRIVLFIWIDL